MDRSQLQPLVPMLIAWIDDTLESHKHLARSVADAGFARLPSCFSARVLETSSFIVVPRVPIPPLSTMGLDAFAEFEAGDYAGITYRDTYFVVESHAENESLHFHELVHVLQWRHLGPEAFLLDYSLGYLEHGYRGMPLEEMAYSLQGEFDAGSEGLDVEARVTAGLDGGG